MEKVKVFIINTPDLDPASQLIFSNLYNKKLITTSVKSSVHNLKARFFRGKVKLRESELSGSIRYLFMKIMASLGL